jgi:hypothetical protein
MQATLPASIAISTTPAITRQRNRIIIYTVLHFENQNGGVGVF